MIITIDGPTASGKSTIARMLANRLSFYYINSGLLYRALAYVFLIEYGFDEKSLYSISYEEAKALYFDRNIIYFYSQKIGPTIFFNKVNITSFLKDPRVEKGASIIAKNGAVREALLEYQRFLADKHNVVADGRDCGTVVFPDADFKFFVTASIYIRAQRWQEDPERNKYNLTLDNIIKLIEEKDKRDMTREIAPLKPAENAIFVDTSNLNTEQTLQIIMSKIRKKNFIESGFFIFALIQLIIF